MNGAEKFLNHRKEKKTYLANDMSGAKIDSDIVSGIMYLLLLF